MSDFDLFIRGREQDIAIADGRFVAVGKSLRGSAREEIDATKMSIFPGVIDSHVHFNEPGRTDWEGFETGSRSAAAGGTTTIFDMPLNSHPPTIDGPSFDAKLAAAQKQSLTDFGLWGGLVPGNLDQLETLRDRGVVGLKAFMCDSGIDDFPYVTMSILHEGMKRAADLDLLVAVHAESQEITERLTKEKIAEGKSSVEDFLETRPVEAELDAIRSAIELSRKTRCRLHIVHVSSGRGVGIVAEAWADGADVTCETCPHYVVLQAGDMKQIGSPAKCAPPLRYLVDHRDLWHRLDRVTSIGSDHSPSPPKMKASKDFFKVWGGISGAQHVLALLADKIPYKQLTMLTSTNVAERFRIGQKGGIAIGRDADLSIVDLSRTVRVTRESLHYRHQQSPYIGRKLPQIACTILRGQIIYRDGKLAPRPIGQFLRPTL